MKKILSLLVICCMLFFVAGCDAPKPEEETTGHQEHSMQLWKNANCKAPKTCAICGYTEGEIGDHSVKVGTCIHCNEFQNKELFDEIKTDLTELSTDLKAANDFLQEKASDLSGNELIYAAAIEAVSPTFDNEKAKLENVLKLCGEYEELASIKSKVQTALDNFPTKPNGTTIEESKAYFSNARKCYTFILDALNQSLYVS